MSGWADGITACGRTASGFDSGDASGRIGSIRESRRCMSRTAGETHVRDQSVVASRDAFKCGGGTGGGAASGRSHWHFAAFVDHLNLRLNGLGGCWTTWSVAATHPPTVCAPSPCSSHYTELGVHSTVTAVSLQVPGGFSLTNRAKAEPRSPPVVFRLHVRWLVSFVYRVRKREGSRSGIRKRNGP